MLSSWSRGAIATLSLQARLVARRQLSAPAAATATGLPFNEGAPVDAPNSSKPQVSDRVRQLADAICALPLIEAGDLSSELKRRFGLPDTILGAVPAVAAAAAPASAAKEEAGAAPETPTKTSFTVKLTKFEDAKKITLIKEVRNVIAGLSLVQAKKFVETAPVTVKEDLGKTEAEELKALLEKAGGVIEIV